MLKTLRFFSYITIVASLSFSCKSSDDSDLFRAYVEGKVMPGPNSAEDFMISPIHLISNNRIIGETFPKENGQFVIAGPYASGDYKLQFKSKIKTFSSTNTSCKIASDSVSIVIPSGVTYLVFNEIKFK